MKKLTSMMVVWGISLATLLVMLQGAPALAAPPSQAVAARAVAGQDASERTSVKNSAKGFEQQYAHRSQQDKPLASFEGGGAGIYIGGSTVAIVLLLVILIIIL